MRVECINEILCFHLSEKWKADNRAWNLVRKSNNRLLTKTIEAL